MDEHRSCQGICQDLAPPSTTDRGSGATIGDHVGTPDRGLGAVTAPSLADKVAALNRRQRRRLLFATLARIIVGAIAMLVVYYALPLDRALSSSSAIFLVAGILALLAVIGRQIQAILHADHPNLRAFQAFGIAIPFLIVVFATSYVLIAQADADNFNTPLSRSSALYFTVTVLSTVGFGDIVPKTDYARIAVSVQMLIDLVLIGILVRVLFGAAQEGVASKQRRAEGSSDDPPPHDPPPHEPSEPDHA